MKHIGLNILLLWLCLPINMQANNKEGKFKKEKTLHRTYQVHKIGEVHIDNEYGNINISTWQKNTVDITANISVDGNDAEDVNKRIQNIQIHLSQTGNSIHAKTTIESTHRSWNLISWISKNSSNVNFKINYDIKMPVQHDLFIDNDYGNIYIDELNGRLNLNADYGKFEIGNLYNNNNKIETDYFSNSSIDLIKGGRITADYSNIHIGQADALQMSCDYTKIIIDKIKKLKYNNDYGSIKVLNGTEIIGSGDYQSRYFAYVDYLKINSDYGSINIQNLLPNFSNIDITCDYVKIKINNQKQVAYRFKIDQEYGCFKQNNLEILRDIRNGGDKLFEGYYLHKDTKSFIRIVEDYGCIKIIN